MKIGVMVLDGPYQHQPRTRPTSSCARRWKKDTRSRGSSSSRRRQQRPALHQSPGGAEHRAALRRRGRAGRGDRGLHGMRQVPGLKPDLRVEHVKLSGLGSLAEFLGKADRFITFGS